MRGIRISGNHVRGGTPSKLTTNFMSKRMNVKKCTNILEYEKKKKTIVAERVIDDFALFQSHFVHDSLLLRDCQVTVIYLGFVIFQKLGESNLLE